MAMQMCFPLVLTFAFFILASQAIDEFTVQDRELHRGRHGRFGYSSSDSYNGFMAPEVSLVCSGDDAVKCTPERRHRGVVELNSGVRVCLQDPNNETNFFDVCMEADATGNTTVFSENDQCGCCGEACPVACSTCTCTGMDRYGEEFSGVYMNVTSRYHRRNLRRGRRHRGGGRHHGSRSGRYGGDDKSIACIADSEIVDKQLKGGTCLETEACPTGCSQCSCTGTTRYGDAFEGFYMKDNRRGYTSCIPTNDTIDAQLNYGTCFDDLEEECPSPCDKCSCTETDSNGVVLFDGFYMNITHFSRHSHRWWSRTTYTTTVCIPTDETVEKKFQNGVCFEDETLCPAE